MQINCTLNDPNIPLPKYESEYASGMDLRAWKYSFPHDLSKEYDFVEEGFNKGLWLQPFQRVLIRTGIHINYPKDGSTIDHEAWQKAWHHYCQCCGAQDSDY